MTTALKRRPRGDEGRSFLHAKRSRRAISVGAVCLVMLLVWSAIAVGVEPIRFEKTQLDSVFRSEGVAVGDFNADGKKDIAVGSVFYAAPDWEMHVFDTEAKEFPIKGYSDAFCVFAEDVNRDGHCDVIVIGMPATETRWYENPGSGASPWRRHVALEVTSNETPIFEPLLGDGRRALICGWNAKGKDPNGPERCVVFAQPGGSPTSLWDMHRLSRPGQPGSMRFSHGLGAGDVNGDGRADIVTTDGWYEQPPAPRGGPWEFHPAPLGEHCADMVVHDFDADGDSDVLSTSAHNYGVWWHEQSEAGWQTHVIDELISQTHAVELADLDGDGLRDFVTGKRYYAHNGKDPGAEEPAELCWYRLVQREGGPVWRRHVIDRDSGVGTQFEIHDVDQDGRLDIVTSNKKGVHLFLQRDGRGTR